MIKRHLFKIMSVMVLAGSVVLVNPATDFAASVDSVHTLRGDGTSVDDDFVVDDDLVVDDGDDSSDDIEINTDVLSFDESESKELFLTIDETGEIAYRYDDTVIDPEKIQIESNDDSVAVVSDWNDEICNVDAYSEGQCTIYLKYDEEIIDSFLVVVESDDSDDSDDDSDDDSSSKNNTSNKKKYAKKISVKKKLTLKVGKTKLLKVTVSPKKTKTKKKITFTSSNKKVATVTAKGKIKAKAKGKAVITVKSSGLKSVKCKVVVR